MKWRAKNQQKKEAIQAQQELKILADEVAAAYDFFRKNRHGYFGGNKKLPLYLLLGPARFGKTTILSQAGLNLKNFNQHNLNYVTPTKYCSFWFTPNALYIDTAGNYTKPEIAKPRNDLIWQGFVKLLQKYFGKNAIAGVLIILDLPAIAQDVTLLKKTLFCVRERTYELAALLEDLTLHIIFTKCDRIAGFVEFFSLLNSEERSQPFGIAFTTTQDKIDPTPTFTNKFNNLLQHLNAQVIERLSITKNPEESCLIKTFPTQFSSLNPILLGVLGQIPSGQRISLSGIYFTSSIQNGSPIDFLKNPLLYKLGLQEKPNYQYEANSNYSYFIEDIFKQVITAPTKKKSSGFHYKYLVATAIALLIVVLSCLISYKSYHKNIATISNVNNLLQNQVITTNIYSLHAEIQKLTQTAQSWWLKLGINKTKSIAQALAKKYNQAFLQILTLQLEQNIKSILRSPQSITTPQKLYSALQAYLMLGDPQKLVSLYLKSWFDTYWSENHDYSTTQKFNLQLFNVLQHKFKVNLNQQIIAAARKSLNDLPLPILVYLSWENMNLNNSKNINTTLAIAKIYTREYFAKIYHTDIPKIRQKLPRYDWVLAKSLSPTSGLVSELRKTYVKQYAAAWATVATNYTPQIAKNLAAAIKDYQALATACNSSLLQLLQQLIINTNITNAPLTLIQALNSNLHGLNTVNLATLQQHLDQLANYFTTMTQEQDPNQTAFHTIVNHLENTHSGFLVTLKDFANTQPPLLNNWLKTITKKSWEVLLEMALQHINQAWQTIVIPPYKTILVNKYPIFKDSKEEISLEDFNQFFAPHKLIDNFFSKYIKPLVNTEKTGWAWKNIDDQTINFSQKTLEIFLRAALIQKMFYPDKTLYPKIQFTLTPLTMTPDTQSFTLHLEGQKITFTHEEKKIYHLVWPGSKPELVTIDFVNQQGKYFNTSQFGVWAWFRILDQTNITLGNNTKNFILTFDLNDNTAKYKLSTPEAINPFIPDIINHFRCPDHLD